jgi:hypothetical protein
LRVQRHAHALSGVDGLQLFRCEDGEQQQDSSLIEGEASLVTPPSMILGGKAPKAKSSWRKKFSNVIFRPFRLDQRCDECGKHMYHCPHKDVIWCSCHPQGHPAHTRRRETCPIQLEDGEQQGRSLIEGEASPLLPLSMIAGGKESVKATISWSNKCSRVIFRPWRMDQRCDECGKHMYRTCGGLVQCCWCHPCTNTGPHPIQGGACTQAH